MTTLVAPTLPLADLKACATRASSPASLALIGVAQAVEVARRLVEEDADDLGQDRALAVVELADVGQRLGVERGNRRCIQGSRLGDGDQRRRLRARRIDRALDQVRRQPARHQRAELVACVRFGQVVVHAGLDADIGVADQRVGGQRDDRQTLRLPADLFPLPDLARRFIAVHHRHLAVHQHDVVAAALHRGQRFLAVGHDVEFATERLQHVARDELVDAVVFGHQHAAVQAQRRAGGTDRRLLGGDAADGLRQCTVELVAAHRLGEISADAGFARPRQLVGRMQRRHEHDAQPRQRRVVAHGGGQRQAIHARHLHVDDRQLEGVAVACGLAQLLQPGQAVVRRRAAHAHRLRVVVEDLGVGGVVVDHQHAAAGQLARVGHRGQALRLLERQREPERRALAFAALDADLAVHQVDQVAADRQAEAGAAEAPRRRAVGLRERREQALSGLVRNADAGVANADVQAPRVVHADGDDDLAAFGELDGVGQQVGQHLAQAVRIAAHGGGQAVVDAAGQFELLRMGARRHQLHHVFDRLVEIEVEGFDLELAGFDLREVEDVVDDRQQRLARAAHGFQERPLLGVERRLEQQLGEPQHAVHRRADLVAHVGQELALGLARVFGGGLGRAQLLLAVAQRLLGQRALCGVEEHGVDADDNALVVDVGHMAAGVPDRVAGAVHALALQRHRLAGQRGGEMRLDVGPQLGADDLAHMLADDLVLALGQPDFLRMVDVAVVALGVDVRHRDRDLIHDPPHAALGALGGIERALLLADIDGGQAASRRLALLVGLRQQLDQQRGRRFIGAQQAAAQTLQAPRQGLSHGRVHGRSMGRPEGIGDRPAFDLVARQAERFGQRVGDFGAMPFGVDPGAQAFDLAPLALRHRLRRRLVDPVGDGTGQTRHAALIAPEQQQHQHHAG